MSISNSLSPPVSLDQDLAPRVRTVVAQQLRVIPQRVLISAHLLNDLGADWLDRLELIMAIEDQFGVEIPDSIVEQLKTVGDLIRYIETCRHH